MTNSNKQQCFCGELEKAVDALKSAVLKIRTANEEGHRFSSSKESEVKQFAMLAQSIADLWEKNQDLVENHKGEIDYVQLRDNFLKEIRSLFGHFNFVTVFPYDDGHVLANSKVSLWFYFGHDPGQNQVSVNVYSFPFERVREVHEIDPEELNSSLLEKLEMDVLPETTEEDIVKWAKPILEKYS